MTPSVLDKRYEHEFGIYSPSHDTLRDYMGYVYAMYEKWAIACALS